MAEKKPEDNAPAELTPAQAAKLVKREVPVMKDGKPTDKTRPAAIGVNEILDVKDYDTYVVVVTKDGQKFRGDK